MNAHAKIEPASVDRTDELVVLLTENIATWYQADRERDKYLEKRISTRREALEEEFSWLPCRSAAAALAKLCIMEADISAALTHIKNEDLFVQVDDLLRRQVGSLIRWIEQEFGIKREAYGLGYYHTDHCERTAWALKIDGEGEIPS